MKHSGVDGLADKIKKLRLVRGLSQQGLATSSGCGRATIVRIEGGRLDPNPKTVKAIAKALGVNAQDLYGEEGPAISSLAPDWVRLVQVMEATKAAVEAGSDKTAKAVDDQKDEFVQTVSQAMKQIANAMGKMTAEMTRMRSEMNDLRREVSQNRRHGSGQSRSTLSDPSAYHKAQQREARGKAGRNAGGAARSRKSRGKGSN